MNTEKIIVKNVSKKFRLKNSGSQSLKAAVMDMVMPRKRREKKEFWALRDLNFTVKSGETLGIIGANGAGKSTLLSLLAGTKTATEGTIETHGTISSLLELGAGFHPELTGRENVYLAGAIMGMSRKQMNERFDAIVEFAGIEKFIDQPVKHYSSGMYVRLGFAVAVEVDPDILLIDEVLSVGDIDFQRKCIKKMKSFREQGKTMLIISHDLHTIQSISDKILFLEQGKVIGMGDPEAVITDYESHSRKEASNSLQREWGTGEVTLTSVEFSNNMGKQENKFNAGESIDIKILYKANITIENPVFGFAISDAEGHLVHGSNTQIESFDTGTINGEGSIVLSISDLALASGNYLFSFSVHSDDHTVNYHRLDNHYSIGVNNPKRFEGSIYLPTKWEK
jgi:ABC-type polysaccharide/polyol phosphate transport system ATPase subunit